MTQFSPHQLFYGSGSFLLRFFSSPCDGATPGLVGALDSADFGEYAVEETDDTDDDEAVSRSETAETDLDCSATWSPDKSSTAEPGLDGGFCQPNEPRVPPLVSGHRCTAIYLSTSFFIYFLFWGFLFHVYIFLVIISLNSSLHRFHIF